MKVNIEPLLGLGAKIIGEQELRLFLLSLPSQCCIEKDGVLPHVSLLSLKDFR